MFPTRATYCTSCEGVASALVRPWHLSWRADFGLAGYMEKETCEQLIQLILTEGFLSNPDLGAVEKLSCTTVPSEFLQDPYKELPSLVDGSGLIRPFSLAYVKGWKRSVALLICLAGIRDLKLEAEISHEVRVSKP